MFSLLEKVLLGTNFLAFSCNHWTNALTVAIHVRYQNHCRESEYMEEK